LVLSEFAGAAAELKGALLTNPHDPNDLTDTLAQALAMDQGEAEDRLRQLIGMVQEFDVDRWGRDFLAAARASADYQKADAIGGALAPDAPAMESTETRD